MGLRLMIKRYGVLYDNRGEELKKIRFKANDTTFKYKERQFNIEENKLSVFKIKGLLFDYYYYFYNIDCPSGFLFDKRKSVIIDSETYNIMLETKLAKQLNDLSKFNLSDYITFTNIVIVCAVIGVIWYFASGGTIT